MQSRRQFLQKTGLGALGFGLWPSLSPLSPTWYNGNAYALPRALPESQGVSSEGISRFIAAANASGLGWHSFMLLRHGQVIAEAWWKPFEAGFTHTLYSLSKSFTSTAIGLLVKEGKLNIQDKLISFFPTELPLSPDANLQEMRIRHLLTMNTGHGEDTMPKMRAGADTWTKTFLAQPVTYQPGSHFLYNTGATYMLGAVLYKITGQTLAEYLAPRLFQPLEIENYNWETSPQGLNTAGYGLRVKTEDIAKFGQMYLQEGKWNGREILTPSWVKEATSYQTSSQQNGDWSAGYGYQFWRCKPGFYRGDGAYGQFCIVMPEQDAVMAVTSESWDMQKSMTTIWENILPAIKTAPLAANPAAVQTLKNDIAKLQLPVVKGLGAKMPAAWKRKKYSIAKNDFSVKALAFDFTPTNCTMIIERTGSDGNTINFGWENWIVNNDSKLYPFPVAGRIHVPSKIAGTATWIDEKTLQLNARFVEAMHGDTITCVFDDDKLTVTFLNSVSEHVKTDPEKRLPLSGEA